MSPLPRPFAPHAGHAADDQVRVFEMSKRTRAVDDVLRLPEREGFHSTADPAADRGAAAQRANGELLQLRCADRPDEGQRVRALRITTVDARHAASPEAGHAIATRG